MFQNKGIGFDDGNLNKAVPDGCEAYVHGNEVTKGLITSISVLELMYLA
jgi:hypothetical protein